MIFNNAENKCILQVLTLLNKKESRYSRIRRETKFSHETIQKVLSNLLKKKFILKDENYKITEEGKKILKKLIELNKMVSS